ncbi:MAG: MraZ N-terminal domain containing protein [Kiritimatiellae bacterium]|jgi:division/cell wall cluster transcriptional repressor MraZ|nr:MraZ N-terminal domain containing protein [Kiritimatiellia bacterium]
MNVNQKQEECTSVGVLVDSVCRSLDPKKRLTISAGWREVMRQPDYVYLMPGKKGDEVKCIDLIPPQVFDSLFKMMQGMSRKDPRWKAVSLICDSASQVYLDIQGRIRIPEKFLKFAELKSKVVMSGSNDRIKICAHDGSEDSAEIDLDAFEAACDVVDF